MAIVTFNSVSKEYAGQQVLRQISFEIGPGQKIGLVGGNGSGKTTILKILCQLVEPSQGNITLGPDVRIGYIPQHVEFDRDEAVIDYLLRPWQRLRDNLRLKEGELSQTPGDKINRQLDEYQKVRDAYDHIGGDHFQGRAEAMIEALGLVDKMQDRVKQLSGGEQNVLTMATALLAEPNLLVLDEPANHLDYLSLAWLDGFLQRFRGAVLIVSHNRYLLDRAVSDIFELQDGRVNQYKGNYSAYRTQRQQQLISQ